MHDSPDSRTITWLPHYPIWSLIIIALDVLVIWALSVHGRDDTR